MSIKVRCVYCMGENSWPKRVRSRLLIDGTFENARKCQRCKATLVGVVPEVTLEKMFRSLHHNGLHIKDYRSVTHPEAEDINQARPWMRFVWSKDGVPFMACGWTYLDADRNRISIDGKEIDLMKPLEGLPWAL